MSLLEVLHRVCRANRMMSWSVARFVENGSVPISSFDEVGLAICCMPNRICESPDNLMSSS